MRPKFGTKTKILAGVFVWASVGSGCAGFNAGHQTTPGTAWFGPELLLLAIFSLAIGCGLWMEWSWAWWTGLGVVTTVVVAGLVRRSFDLGWFLYLGFLALFAVSATYGQPPPEAQRHSRDATNETWT